MKNIVFYCSAQRIVAGLKGQAPIISGVFYEPLPAGWNCKQQIEEDSNQLYIEIAANILPKFHALFRPDTELQKFKRMLVCTRRHKGEDSLALSVDVGHVLGVLANKDDDKSIIKAQQLLPDTGNVGFISESIGRDLTEEEARRFALHGKERRQNGLVSVNGKKFMLAQVGCDLYLLPKNLKSVTQNALKQCDPRAKRRISKRTRLVYDGKEKFEIHFDEGIAKCKCNKSQEAIQWVTSVQDAQRDVIWLEKFQETVRQEVGATADADDGGGERDVDTDTSTSTSAAAAAVDESSSPNRLTALRSAQSSPAGGLARSNSTGGLVRTVLEKEHSSDGSALGRLQREERSRGGSFIQTPSSDAADDSDAAAANVASLLRQLRTKMELMQERLHRVDGCWLQDDVGSEQKLIICKQLGVLVRELNDITVPASMDFVPAANESKEERLDRLLPNMMAQMDFKLTYFQDEIIGNAKTMDELKELAVQANRLIMAAKTLFSTCDSLSGNDTGRASAPNVSPALATDSAATDSAATDAADSSPSARPTRDPDEEVAKLKAWKATISDKQRRHSTADIGSIVRADQETKPKRSAIKCDHCQEADAKSKVTSVATGKKVFLCRPCLFKMQSGSQEE